MLGAIIGDIVGSKYEFNNIKTKNFPLFSDGCYATDDSVMTIAVLDICINKNIYNKDKIIDTLKKWGRRYPQAGYGGTFYSWVLGDDRLPYYSYGNGAAMRISPVAYFAKSEEEVKEFSRRITEVTHNHPEGLKGAEVTAMMIYKALHGATKRDLEEYAVSCYPEIKNFDYEELKRTYTHAEEICQNTVPQAIYCFLISKDFEDCLRTTISIGGDCDTTAAISCAIAEAYYGDGMYGISFDMFRYVVNYLPKDMIKELKKLKKYKEMLELSLHWKTCTIGFSKNK